MKKLILLALVPMFAFAAVLEPDHSVDRCTGFLQSLHNDKITEYFLSQLTSKDEAFKVLSEFGLLDSQEFNEAVFLTLKKHGIKLQLEETDPEHLRFSSHLYKFTEKLSNLIQRWDVKETSFTFGVLDSYVEVLRTQPKNLKNIFYVSRAEKLAASIKKSQMGRYAFTQAVLMSLKNTLVHAMSNVELTCDLYSQHMPLYTGMDFGISPTMYFPFEPLRPHFDHVLKASERSSDEKSVLKQKPSYTETHQPLSLKMVCESPEVLAWPKVDIAYVDQIELTDIWIQSNSIAREYQSYAAKIVTYRKNISESLDMTFQTKTLFSEFKATQARRLQLMTHVQDLIKQLEMRRNKFQFETPNSEIDKDRVAMLSLVFGLAEKDLAAIHDIQNKLSLEYRVTESLLRVLNAIGPQDHIFDRYDADRNSVDQTKINDFKRTGNEPKLESMMAQVRSELLRADRLQPLYPEFLESAKLYDQEPEMRAHIIQSYFEFRFSLSYGRHYIALLREPSLSNEFKQDLYNMIKRVLGADNAIALKPFKEVAVKQGLLVFL